MPIAQHQKQFFNKMFPPLHQNNSRQVVNCVTRRFGEQWIGINYPISWPVISDLTPFFLCAHLRNKVHTIREDLETRMRVAIAGITQEQLSNLMTANFQVKQLYVEIKMVYILNTYFITYVVCVKHTCKHCCFVTVYK